MSLNLGFHSKFVLNPWANLCGSFLAKVVPQACIKRLNTCTKLNRKVCPNFATKMTIIQPILHLSTKVLTINSRKHLPLPLLEYLSWTSFSLTSRMAEVLHNCHRIQKFHYSWKIPGIFWNSWYRLALANFLPILTYWASIPLNFCHWTWIWP